MSEDNQADALQICSAIGSSNVDDMAAVLAVMPEAEKQNLLEISNRLNGKRNPSL